jgi:hypothetical protein
MECGGVAWLGRNGVLLAGAPTLERVADATHFVPGLGVLSLVLLPAAIYFLSYGHFLLTGHGLSDLLALHQSMLSYHRDLGAVHPYSSSWWEWPMAARPVWYYAAT